MKWIADAINVSEVTFRDERNLTNLTKSRPHHNLSSFVDGKFETTLCVTLVAGMGELKV